MAPKYALHDRSDPEISEHRVIQRRLPRFLVRSRAADRRPAGAERSAQLREGPGRRALRVCVLADQQPAHPTCQLEQFCE